MDHAGRPRGGDRARLIAQICHGNSRPPKVRSLGAPNAGADFFIFSMSRLDSSRIRSGEIRTTNSENVGSQSHSLRQPVRGQHSLRIWTGAEKPNNGGPLRTNLRTSVSWERPNIR